MLHTPAPKRRDLYAVLQVAKGATAREIKRAFSERVKQFNPEKHGDDKEKYQKAVRNRKIVTRAYQVLSDPELRARYDRGEPVE